MLFDVHRGETQLDYQHWCILTAFKWNVDQARYSTVHNISLSLSLQWHYSQGWTLSSFKSFLHPSRFRATTVQFLHPSFAVSSFTPSSQRSLGFPLGHFPPGSLRRTLLEKSSSWRMTRLPISIYSACRISQHHSHHIIDRVLSSNSSSSPINHWAINSPEDFTLKNTKTMFILFR